MIGLDILPAVAAVLLAGVMIATFPARACAVARSSSGDATRGPDGGL